MNFKILIVDDENAHRKMLTAVLGQAGYDTFEAADGAQAVKMVQARFFDLILMDIRMAGVGGMAAQAEINKLNPGIPIIFMTAYGSVENAVKAMKSGAYDYLTKPLDIDELKIVVSRALHVRQLEQDNQYLKERLKERFDFSNIIGTGEGMKQLFEMISQAAPTEATVLITGESGTGKELIANAIHQNSARNKRPMITVNCAALPESLLESELFGHEKGAFTGATTRKKGRFQQAHNSSLFLDEIGEMPPSTQAKILRALQEGEIQTVGGSGTLHVDARIIAATNKDLEEEVKAGRFREDLYYRLNVVRLHATPLRERREDIPLLCDHFLKKYAEKNRKLIKGVAPSALHLLARHYWPGNVRELENTMERAIIMTRSDFISPSDLPETISQIQKTNVPGVSGITPGRPLKEVEKEMILRTLEETGGNRTHAAKILGISRRTLQLKLKEYGVN